MKDGIFATVTDGLANIVANLGTDRDKKSHSFYMHVSQDDSQLINMYRGSGIARKIVDLPAEDSVREWREWQAPNEMISKLEAEETRLHLQKKILTTQKRARLFGGCVLFIKIRGDDGRTNLPLDPKTIGIGDIEHLTVFNRSDISAGPLIRDPRSPKFGLPSSYHITGMDGGTLEIHPTRLVVFLGEEHPDERYSGSNQGWGDSSLLSCLDSVTNLDATIGNIASLVFEAKIDVMGIEGFNAGLRDGGKPYEDLVIARSGLASRAKGINGALLMDKEDEYSQKSANFSNLPAVATTFQQMVSAASSIPMSMLFEQTAGGLSSSGESDTRSYYDRVKVLQTLEMTPAMSILDECLIRSALGSRSESIHYNWKPLWQPTAKERAEVGKINSEAIKNLDDLGIIAPEALGEAAVNAMTESGAFPGLESAVEKYKTPEDSHEGEEDDT